MIGLKETNQVMRATKLFLLIITAFSYASAQDEYWGIYQFKKNISDDHFVFAEYVRRDKNTFFDAKNLELTRLSWAGKWKSWNYLIGASYVDFNSTNDERRLHQFFIRNFKMSDAINSSVRTGLEQRSFINDDLMYIRFRLRGQINFQTSSFFGLSAYDEMLFSINGGNRFYQGLNENRLGLGINFKFNAVDFYIYQTFATLKTLTVETNPRWLQLQTIFNF